MYWEQCWHIWFHSNTAILEKYFFVFGKSVVKAKFFSPKIHRQKNAPLVRYGKWLNSGDNGDSLLYTCIQSGYLALKPQHLLYKTSKAEFLPSLLISLYSNEVEKWFPFGIHLSHLSFWITFTLSKKKSHLHFALNLEPTKACSV